MTASAQTSVVTFEQAELASDGTLQGTSYEENGIVFENYYSAQSWYNSGYTVSANTDRNTAGYTNQYSVDARGGAAGSKQFMVYNPCFYESCYIRRADNASFAPKEVAVALTTYTSISMQDGDSSAKKFEKGDFFTMHIQGLDAENNVLSSMDVELVNYPHTWFPWATIDLSPLGTVNKVFIDFSSSDSSEWAGVLYMNTPAYIALDNFTVEEKATEITSLAKEGNSPKTQAAGTFSLSGQRVSKDYKGVVIQNGKKVILN